MKVLQTLGHSGGSATPTAFFYRRTHVGIEVSNINEEERFTITHNNWKNLLSGLMKSEKKVFKLSGKSPEDETLYAEVIKILSPIIAGLTPSDIACVIAILEHEGSIDHYGGGSVGAMHFRKDVL